MFQDLMLCYQSEYYPSFLGGGGWFPGLVFGISSIGRTQTLSDQRNVAASLCRNRGKERLNCGCCCMKCCPIWQFGNGSMHWKNIGRVMSLKSKSVETTFELTCFNRLSYSPFFVPNRTFNANSWMLKHYCQCSENPSRYNGDDIPIEFELLIFFFGRKGFTICVRFILVYFYMINFH